MLDFNKIIYCYHDLGEKKLLKKSLKFILVILAKNEKILILANREKII